MPVPSDIAPMVPVLRGRMRLRYLLFIAVWAAGLIYFWRCWLNPAAFICWPAFLLVTVTVLWLLFLQVFFGYVLLHATRSGASDTLPGQYRVAMIVTKTPSEPFGGLRTTLLTMLAQDYPHDTWIADEDPTVGTIACCAAHDVRISTRKGKAAYHQPVWPRRTRYNEGNLAHFYDHWGYADYDIVSQLDAAHVPQPGYLCEVLQPLADPIIGYVSALSMCGANADDSWSARSRLRTEAAFHGICQCG